MVSVLQLKTDSTVDHPNIHVLTNSVAIDDFESGKFDFTVLGRSTGSEWYTYNDTDSSSETSLFNSLLDTYIKSTDEGGYALKIVGELKSETDSTRKSETSDIAYVGVGFPIGESYVDRDTIFNLSTLDSLTFSAKGHGVIRVKFGSQYTDSIYEGEWNDLGASIDINSNNWEQYSVTPEMLTLSSEKMGNDISWSDISKTIIRIEFEFNEKQNPLDTKLIFWIDDIYLNGLNLEQLLNGRDIIED